MVPLQDISTLSTLFYRFITLWKHVLRLKFAIQAMGTLGFPQNILRDVCTFLCFPAPTKAPIPSNCVLIDSLRPFFRRFSFFFVLTPVVVLARFLGFPRIPAVL